MYLFQAYKRRRNPLNKKTTKKRGGNYSKMIFYNVPDLVYNLPNLDKVIK